MQYHLHFISIEASILTQRLATNCKSLQKIKVPISFQALNGRSKSSCYNNVTVIRLMEDNEFSVNICKIFFTSLSRVFDGVFSLNFYYFQIS